jgi:hypothetical protein
MRIDDRTRAGLWVAALGLAALGSGLVGGLTFGAEAGQSTRVFVDGAPAGMILSYVKSGQSTAFEQTMSRVGEALAASENAERRQQAVGWKIYKATAPLEEGVLLYISVFNPVVSGADHWVPQILNEAFPTEVQKLYETYVGAFADGEILLSLSPVLQP